MTTGSRKRDGRRLTDAEVEAADDHWIKLGETASAKLLALLEKHHKETAPAPPSTDAVKEGDGSG